MTALTFAIKTRSTPRLNSLLWRQNRLQHWLPTACILALGLCVHSQAQAQAVVTQPTEAALDAALAQVAQGGTITFACDGTIPITATKKIAVVSPSTTAFTVTLDATGHNITLNGGGSTALFAAVGRSVHIPGGPSDSGRVGHTNYYKASLTLKHLTLTNSAGSAAAATIGDVTATDCAFTNNKSTQGSGAISVNTTGSVSASGCTFLNNTTAGSGGAIYASSLGTLNRCVFMGNAANGPAGTAVSPPSCNGGAVYGVSGSSIIANCAFLNNRLTAGAYSSVNGGALMLASPANSNITNCTFAGNSATSGSSNHAHGGAFYCNTTSSYGCTLTNCTVANNLAVGGQGGDGGGGGIYNGAGKLTLVNTLVVNNLADYQSNAGGISLTDGGHNLCSDASAAFTSANSFNNTDARLGPIVYTGGGIPTLSLMAGSPAIDAGDDTKAPTTDSREASRQGSHSDIGAYERPVWQADGIGVGPDAKTRLLWNKGDGSVQMWNVDTTAGTYQLFCAGGPISAGIATNICVGGDNATNILWQNTNGRALLWRIDTATGAFLNQHFFGPIPGWTATGMAVGSDNNQRVLWSYPTGSGSLWNVDVNTGSPLAPGFYNAQAPDYKPTAIATGADGNTRMLWNNPNGQMFVWSVSPTTGQVVGGFAGGPIVGWNATHIACGRDNWVRLLWQDISGNTSLWCLETNGGQLVSAYTFAARSGWNAAGISVGADGNTRLLWQHLDGETQLWNVDAASGNVLSTQDFGPLN